MQQEHEKLRRPSTTPCKTQEQFRDLNNPNRLMSRFLKTGEFPARGVLVGGDFVEVPDLAHALIMAREAREAFALLPADVRKRFGGDVEELVQWTADPGNRDEALVLGLLQGTPDDVEAARSRLNPVPPVEPTPPADPPPA